MKSEGLAHFSDTWMTTTGLLLFIAAFVAVVFWIMRPSSNKYFQRAENLPFNDGE